MSFIFFFSLQVGLAKGLLSNMERLVPFEVLFGILLLTALPASFGEYFTFAYQCRVRLAVWDLH